MSRFFEFHIVSQGPNPEVIGKTVVNGELVRNINPKSDTTSELVFDAQTAVLVKGSLSDCKNKLNGD